jgi:hypothetical protein
MPGVARTTILNLLAALLSVGCAEHLQLRTRGVAVGGLPLSFWPPPDATETWSGRAEAAPSRYLGEAADRVAVALRSAGYTEQRWYAVGARYAHGFMVTTRLERMQDDGAPEENRLRWSSRFPEAPELLWLEGARKTRLPGAGRYRVLLVAFTDLPIGATDRAQRRNEETWMAERPDVPSTELPSMRRVSSDYRVAVYEYEYQSGASASEGAFVPYDEAPSSSPPVPVLSTLLGAQRQPHAPAFQ